MKNQKNNYIRSNAHMYRRLPGGNYVSLYDPDFDLNPSINVIHSIDFAFNPKPSTRERFMEVLRGALRKILPEIQDEGFRYKQSDNPTEYGVSLTQNGVTVHAVAVCEDPGHGTNTGWDIQVTAIESRCGEDLLPFFNALDLTEQAAYGIHEACEKHIHIDITEVELYRGKATADHLEKTRQSYL